MVTSIFSLLPIVGMFSLTLFAPGAIAAVELGADSTNKVQTGLELRSSPVDAKAETTGKTSTEGTVSSQEGSTAAQAATKTHIRTPQICRRMGREEQRNCLKLLPPRKHEPKEAKETEETAEGPAEGTEREETKDPTEEPSKPKEEMKQQPTEPSEPRHERPSGRRERVQPKKHREKIQSSMKHIWRSAKDLSPEVRVRLEAEFKAEVEAAHEVCVEKFSRTEKSTCLLKAKTEARANLRAKIQAELQKNKEE